MRQQVRSTVVLAALACARLADAEPLFNDAHFHLTNYVQQGPGAAKFLEVTACWSRCRPPPW